MLNIRQVIQEISSFIPSGEFENVLSEIRSIEDPVYPFQSSWFKAIQITGFHPKVIILGQDPYHGPGQANGLAFSVNRGIKIPPSLRNIYKELGISPGHGDLTNWANQGVLLLNTALTVVESQPGTHAELWKNITDGILKRISMNAIPRVFMLWGKHAQRKKDVIFNKSIHKILETSHPSPLSARRGFLGSNHFTLANDFLREKGREEIEWRDL